MRIINIIKTSAPEIVEVIGMLILFLFAYTLLFGNPHIFSSSLTFTLVIKTFSEFTWGLIFLTLATTKGIAIETGYIRFRQIVSTLIELLWLTWFVLIMLSPVWGFVSGVSLLFFTISTWIFIRLSLSVRDETDALSHREERKEQLLKDL